MITEAFQVILKYVTPDQEDIVIQNVCKKLSFASNDSEEKLDSMAEALNEAYQQQNDRINQLQILCSICTLTNKLCDEGKITEISTRTDCLKLIQNENMQY
jgi:hypothetical protein